MAVVDVQNINGEKVSQIDISDKIFNVPVKSVVLHEVTKMQMACRRSGTASVKHRSDVKGSGRKLFRQKGTGRARRGDIKAPLLSMIELERIKTKEFLKVLDAFNMKNALIITDKKNENLELSSRNVPGVKVLRSEGLNVYDILKYENLVLLESAIKAIEGRLPN